ncbi:MAG TPA: ABC transporter permease [Ignavibacteriaceae bacterium]|nr:ABC transporter permease [Ignavibacteriaceae bacterium]
MFKKFTAVVKKEVRQLKRDHRMLFVIFSFPVLLLIMFGYAINFDVKNINLAVYDQDKSDISREIINSLQSSGYFKVVAYLNRYQDADKYLDDKISQVVIIIPKDFSKKINSSKDVSIQYLIDGVDGNTASIIQNYVNSATFSFSNRISQKILARNGSNSYQPISLEAVFWYNPSLQTTKFLVPGLIAMILIITAVISVSLSLVREKERGTQEQLNVSPLSSFELLLGKVVPYLTIALINAALILIASYFLFGVEIKGSYTQLLLTTLLFLFTSTALGIFISVVSDSQQVAFTLATFISLLPSIILSGFVFPVDNMPLFVQIITNVTPTKFYLVMLRSIMLKGVGITAFYDQVIYLVIYATVILLLGTIINNRKTQAA